MDELPKSSKEDVAYTLAKAGIASLPLIGNGAAEVFELIIAPPLSKRRDEWLIELGRSLQTLQEKYEGFNIQTLQQNEVFLSIVLQASQAAMKTHQREKIRHLRNAVLNSVQPNPPDESVQQTFVRLIDESTVWHVKLLQLFTQGAMPNLHLDKDNWRMNMGVDQTFNVICNYFPEMRSQYDLFLTILEDLAQQGLIGNIHPSADMMSRLTHSPEITRFGQALLKFLESPLDE